MKTEFDKISESDFNLMCPSCKGDKVVVDEIFKPYRESGSPEMKYGTLFRIRCEDCKKTTSEYAFIEAALEAWKQSS